MPDFPFQNDFIYPDVLQNLFYFFVIHFLLPQIFFFDFSAFCISKPCVEMAEKCLRMKRP